MTKMLRQARVAILAMAAVAVMGCGREPLTGVPDAPALAKGSRPGGGTSTGITATKLGNLKLIGCTWADAYAVSSASSQLVVGMAGGCSSPAYNKPFIWSAATGTAATGKSLGGWPMAVSDNGVMVGGSPGGAPAEFDMTGTAKALPLPTGVTWGQATGVTSDGLFAVGYGSTDYNPYKALWWSRTSVAGSWQTAEIIGEGMARAVAAGGSLVVGVSGGNAVAWRRSGTTWATLVLQPAGPSEAMAVNASGTMIAGERFLSLPKDPTTTYDQHTVWIASGGNWMAEKLTGADPNFDEGQALGIADQTDGSTLAVGFSWQDTSGSGGTRWAVAWRRASGATAFGPPILLQPLSTTWGAIASGVNTRGAVVGTGNTGSGSLPVMWNVPASP